MTTEPTTETERDTQWQSCCTFARNLHRRPDALARYQAKLESGYRSPYTDDARLMPTALALVAGMGAAGVRRWSWLPAPSTEDLADPAAWATRRLAERRTEQDEAERDRRERRKEARAFGQLPPGNGATNPVHLQQSKHSLDELARRLELVIAQHTKRGEFRRQDLDHRAKHYIRDRDGGISNKQVVLMANLIVGRQERRPFDENWKIVTDWLRERQTTNSGTSRRGE